MKNKKDTTEADFREDAIEKILAMITKDVMGLLRDMRKVMKRLEILEREMYEKADFVSVDTVTSRKGNCVD